MRLLLLFASLAVALALAALSGQTPRPRPADAPERVFSAGRAMADIEAIARAPHPTGSAEHARVKAYLAGRLRALGLEVAEQRGPLSPSSIRRLERAGGDPSSAGGQAANLVGRLPGRNPAEPAVLLMAHYDTVAGSPGAADNSTGVAAVLETVRAIRARGPTERDVIVLLSDAEELGLDGARLFFERHPLSPRVGAVINLEARGGGGRAAMFETGRGDGPTIRLFRQAVSAADGGATASSLAVFMYERMPNGTDFTISKNRGVPGLNFAFIGRPALYHSPEATPANLDQGAVQHIGSQALEAADVLARAPALPRQGPNLVYSDLLGLRLASHPTWAGWLLLALAAAFGAFAAWRARRAAKLSPGAVLVGVAEGVWFLAAGIVLSQALRLLAGPTTSRAASPETYYVLLRRLPWMEAGAALAVLSLALLLLAGGRARFGRPLAAGAALLTVACLVCGGFNPVVLAAGAIAAGLSLWPRSAASTWGGWLGLMILVFLAACMLQATAPEAALLFVWPLLLAAAAAALWGALGPMLDGAAPAPAAVATALGGAWLMAMGHLVFLGIGMDLPGALALIGFLILLFARPLAPSSRPARKALAAAAALAVLLAAGSNLAARIAEPDATVMKALP